MSPRPCEHERPQEREDQQTVHCALPVGVADFYTREYGGEEPSLGDSRMTAHTLRSSIR